MISVFFSLQFRNRLTETVPFLPSLEITSRLFAVSHDGKFIFSGGHWDSSLCIYSLVKSKSISSYIHHSNVITCVALDSTGFFLVTGSRDTTCIIWYLLSNEDEKGSIVESTLTLHGHQSEVTCVSISSELDLVASGSMDGTCNIYTVEHGEYIRTLKPTGDRYDPIVNVRLSEERHILVQTEREETHLFLYSINGALIRTRKFDYRIIDIFLSNEFIILAVNQSSTLDVKEGFSKNQNAPLEVARIIIKNLFEYV